LPRSTPPLLRHPERKRDARHWLAVKFRALVMLIEVIERIA